MTEVRLSFVNLAAIAIAIASLDLPTLTGSIIQPDERN
jgi:hypothetical protein